MSQFGHVCPPPITSREGTQDQYFAGLNFSDVSQPNKHINIHFYISRLRNPPSFYKNVNIDRPGEVVEVRGGGIEVAVGIPFPTLPVTFHFGWKVTGRVTWKVT